MKFSFRHKSVWWELHPLIYILSIVERDLDETAPFFLFFLIKTISIMPDVATLCFMIAQVAETLALWYATAPDRRLCTWGRFIYAPHRRKFARVSFGPNGSALTLRWNQKWQTAAGQQGDLFCPECLFVKAEVKCRNVKATFHHWIAAWHQIWCWRSGSRLSEEMKESIKSTSAVYKHVLTLCLQVPHSNPK